MRILTNILNNKTAFTLLFLLATTSAATFVTTQNVLAQIDVSFYGAGGGANGNGTAGAGGSNPNGGNGATGSYSDGISAGAIGSGSGATFPDGTGNPGTDLSYTLVTTDINNLVIVAGSGGQAGSPGTGTSPGNGGSGGAGGGLAISGTDISLTGNLTIPAVSMVREPQAPVERLHLR